MHHGIKNCRRVGKFTANTFHKTSWQNIDVTAAAISDDIIKITPFKK